MSKKHKIITKKTSNREYLKELFSHQELFFFFVWRDLIIRYKQTVLGVFWALFRPFLNVAIFVVVFDKVAHLPSQGISYPLFVLAAMIPWQWVASTIQSATVALSNHSQLITKIYFPRMLLPISSVIVNGVDLLVGYALFLPLLLFFGYLTNGAVVLFPFLVFHTFLLSLSIGLWLSALTVRYRDMIVITPFLMQVGLFVSPVGYSSDLFPVHWQWLYQLNPMVGLIDAFRFSLFDIASFTLTSSYPASVTVTILLLVGGFFYFKRMEQDFADII